MAVFQTPREYATGTFFASERQVYLRDLQPGRPRGSCHHRRQPIALRAMIAIQPGYGDGRFEPEERYNTGGRSAFLAFGDVDNDGILDILSSNPNGTSFSTY